MAKTLTIGPGVLPIVCRKGATFDKTFTWKTENPDTGVRTPVDLTGALSARFVIRLAVDTPDPPIIDLGLGSGITLGDEDGTIRIVIDDAVTAAWDFVSGVYDLKIEMADGTMVPLFGGTFKVTDGAID